MKIIESNLKFKANHQNRSGKVNGIVLHHAAADGSVETVHGWHLNNGWAGIGYHFYVRKDGKVYRGRPENWIGAHTSGHNDKIGICAEGNFDKETMSTAQKNAIIELLNYLFNKYGKVKVYGHRDLDSTACPGKNYPIDSIVNGKTESKDTVTIKMAELEKGAEGEQVKTLQRLLIALGYKLEKYGADGDFGSETETAVKKFQRDHGLAADGIVGEKTWTKILKG